LFRRISKRPRSDSSHGLEHLREVTLTLISNRRGDLAYRKRRLRQQLSCTFQPHVRQICVRSDPGDLLEQPREMVFRKISRLGDLFECKLAAEVVVHELDRTAKPPINQPGAR